MTNSERAAADQRLMDAMQKVDDTLPVYEGSLLRVCLYSALIPIWLLGNAAHRTTLRLDDARTLHRELGEALAAIEAQFGEKPEPIVPPKCTGPGAPCGCSIHFTPGRPFGEAFTMNYPAPEAVHIENASPFSGFGERLAAAVEPEDAPGTRETIWGSWSDTPVSK